ncbi:MAG: hypothetical protein WCH99_10615 [Verrucomicrobiota bacterium]
MKFKHLLAAILISFCSLSAAVAENMPAKFKSDTGDSITVQLRNSASLRLHDNNGKLVTAPMDFSSSASFDFDSLKEITVLAKKGDKLMVDRMLIVTDRDGTSVATFVKSEQTNVTEHNRSGHNEESAKRIKDGGYHAVLHLTKVKDQ